MNQSQPNASNSHAIRNTKNSVFFSDLFFSLIASVPPYIIQSTPRDIKRKLFIYKYVHIVPFSSTLTSSITDHWLWNYVSVPKIMSMLALILPTITEKLG